MLDCSLYLASFSFQIETEHKPVSITKTSLFHNRKVALLTTSSYGILKYNSLKVIIFCMRGRAHAHHFHKLSIARLYATISNKNHLLNHNSKNDPKILPVCTNQEKPYTSLSSPTEMSVLYHKQCSGIYSVLVDTYNSESSTQRDMAETE